ncbi:MAG: hypothetical protein K8T26_09510 [Lentisphaerae bacterium]|nr:hypothetical protein [Lentisphaerota bacterium]
MNSVAFNSAAVLVFLLLAARLPAEPTITRANRFSHGANIGWIDWRPGTNMGASIGEFYCGGQIYSANCGWISLGSGRPANGHAFGNQSAGDSGVNMDGAGNLRGFAYGANIGWIAFESNGAPRVDILTGALTGHAYGANVGWISLSNAQAFVETATLDVGPDTDHDAMPDAWEWRVAGGLDALRVTADADADGLDDAAEFIAGTSPLNPDDCLAFTGLAVMTNGVALTLSWASKPNRLYAVEATSNLLSAAAWRDDGSGWRRPGTGDTSQAVVFVNAAPATVYRIQVRRFGMMP